MQYYFKKGPEPFSWMVKADRAVIGLLRSTPSALANLGKSKTKPTFQAHGFLWEASTDGVGLDEDEVRAIARHITRRKTTRVAAADHLVAAYRLAGVELPSDATDDMAA